MELELELATYQAHHLELMANAGRFVVIKGQEILPGAWDTYEEALQAGSDRYGLTPFLVKRIEKSEPILYFSRDLR